MPTRQTLPVAKAHLSCSRLIPISYMHVGMKQALRLVFVHRESEHGRRPHGIAFRQHFLRYDVRCSIEGLPRVALQIHLPRTDGEPARVRGDPSVLGCESGIAVEAGVQRSEK